MSRMEFVSYGMRGFLRSEACGRRPGNSRAENTGATSATSTVVTAMGRSGGCCGVVEFREKMRTSFLRNVRRLVEEPAAPIGQLVVAAAKNGVERLSVTTDHHRRESL